MRIAVLGTGMVGETLATAFVSRGHAVTMGSRDAANPKATSWAEHNGADAGAGSFAQAAANADLVVNATSGTGSLPALEAAGADALAGKVLIDVANPLDFTAGMPPSLFVSNTDSLAEQIQRAYPDTRVVKSLNTVNCRVMVDPSRVPGGHTVFVAGDDEAAKQTVTGLLRELGWAAEDVVDLGGISAARGMEMYLVLWLNLMQQVGSPDFNIKLVRA